MSGKDKRTLKAEAAAFVRSVITDVYRQRASQATVDAVAQRVIQSLPKMRADSTHTTPTDKSAQ